MTDRRDLLFGLAAASAASLAAPSALAQDAGHPSGIPIALTDPEIGAAGDGITDDSDAFNRWIALLLDQRRPGFVPAGRYRVPGANAISTHAPLVIRGAGRDLAILDGEGRVPDNAFHLGATLDIEGLAFVNWGRLFVVTDGTDQDSSYDPFPGLSWDADIDTIRIADCAFRDTRQPTYFWSGGTQYDENNDYGHVPRVHRIVIRGNLVERAWAGFFIGLLRLNDVWIEDNEIRDIDGTPAGYSTSGNACIRGGAGRAILVGRDRGAFERESGRFFIRGNVIVGVHDRRVAPNTGAFPEVQGINVVGARDVEVTGNTVEDVYSDPPDAEPGAVTDCEGLYMKAVHVKIAHNVFRNCGRGEATITLKGMRYAVRGRHNHSAAGSHAMIHHNTLLWTRDDRPREIKAIRLGGDHHIVTHNYIEGFGDPTDTAYGPIYEPDQGGQDSIIVAENIIRNCRFLYGIALRAGGSGRTVRGNIVDGLDGSHAGPDQDVIAIFVRTRREDDPLDQLHVVDNQVRNLRAASGSETVAIGLWAHRSPMNAVRVSGNLLAADADIGVRLTGLPFDSVTIDGNHLGGVGQAVRQDTEIRGLSAQGNLGWSP